MEVEVITERFVICPFEEGNDKKVLLEQCEECPNHNYKIGSFGMVDKVECKKEEKC